MWELLASPIDPGRVHDIGFAVSWHARIMVVAWAVLAPLAIIIARFFKILPKQNWPVELDTTFWWRSHWMGQVAVVILSIIGFSLVLPSNFAQMSLHNWLGYGVLFCVLLQVLLGIFRGSKGGPTAPAPDGSLRGHHYDMTPWRLMFETAHKALGYFVVLLAAMTILAGLWKANAPVWMWLSLAIWWPLVICAFVVMQRRGMAIDTYQAIWGSDPSHPGNRLPHPGWGVRRPGDDWKGDADVRRDRGDRLRGH